jgi:hypothetical protein
MRMDRSEVHSTGFNSFLSAVYFTAFPSDLPI